MTRCGDARCGRPRTGPGRAPSGWLNLRQAAAADKGRWFCSTACLLFALTHTGFDPRLDVASCAVCVNRHDREHRCGVCGSAPQIYALRPAAARQRFRLDPRSV